MGLFLTAKRVADRVHEINALAAEMVAFVDCQPPITWRLRWHMVSGSLSTWTTVFGASKRLTWPDQKLFAACNGAPIDGRRVRTGEPVTLSWSSRHRVEGG